MSKEKQEKTSTEAHKPHHKTLRLAIALLILLVTGFFLWRIFFYKSVDEQLAEIQARLAIPDSDNAAYYYRQFFNDSNNAAALEDLSFYCGSSKCAPWKNADSPELASLFEEHRLFIETLLEISQHKQALFQIYPDPLSDVYSISPLIRKVTFILSWSAANDLGEGRTDEALAKYACQVRIALHLRQQPLSSLNTVGLAIEAVGLNNVRDFVMRDAVTVDQLSCVGSLTADIDNCPEPDPATARTLDRLAGSRRSRQIPMIDRFRSWLEYERIRAEEEARMAAIRKRIASKRKGLRILLALQRRRKSTGKWPASLDEIKAEVSGDALIDPLNDGPFVYRLTDEGFVLYSRGENNIDENGRRAGSANAPDDWAIWPEVITQKMPLPAPAPNERPAE